SLGQKAKRVQSEAALARVDDPRAVPSIWKVFAAAGPDHHERAVLLLRPIDSPAASRALASLAAFGGTTDVRHLAAESLTGRDPREFASQLIGLLRDPVSYEVREVRGPGSPGELYVQGKRLNTRLFYQAPSPLTTPEYGDQIVGFDASGLPITNRVVGYAPMPIGAAIDPRMMGASDFSRAPEILGHTSLGQAGQALGQRMLQNQQQTTAIANGIQNYAGPYGYVMMPLVAQVPVGRLMAQAGQQAASSEQRLKDDVAALDRYNKDIEELNERALAALRTGCGKDLGTGRPAWARWWSLLVETLSASPPPPRESGSEGNTSRVLVEPVADVPSFAAETPVWTISGLRPVEDLRAGDKVLTQDTTTGALGFSAVLTIRRSASEPVKSVSAGTSTLVATELERLWVVGKGFVKVRDMKPGDAVRALGGIVRVTAIDDAKARPVHNIEVAEGRGILVGSSGILAQDERLAQPVTAPFDAAANTAELGPGRPH
ncbi:MAG TPA: hypothetical protein VGZ22_11165, partial [Isosphaeraceae bacterium]|nr:hypothetical protein [Isosphaeraceae bacterium]